MQELCMFKYGMSNIYITLYFATHYIVYDDIDRLRG